MNLSKDQILNSEQNQSYETQKYIKFQSGTNQFVRPMTTTIYVNNKSNVSQTRENVTSWSYLWSVTGTCLKISLKESPTLVNFTSCYLTYFLRATYPTKKIINPKSQPYIIYIYAYFCLYSACNNTAIIYTRVDYKPLFFVCYVHSVIAIQFHHMIP